MVHNNAEFLAAYKEANTGDIIIFDEVSGSDYGMAAAAMRHAEAMFDKAQTTLGKLEPQVEAKKKEDRKRLMLLRKEQNKFVNKVNKQAQRR